jgi:hypothetical protein
VIGAQGMGDVNGSIALDLLSFVTEVACRPLFEEEHLNVVFLAQPEMCR